MTDQQHGDTPDTPEAAPDAPTTVSPKPKKKKSRTGDIITVVVLLAIMLPIAYFWAEVKTGLQMQIWSKSAPRDAMKQLQDAFAAGDVETTKSFFRSETWNVTVEGGKIAGVRDALGQQAPTLPVEKIAPSGEMGDAKVSFRVKAVNPGADVTVATPDGGTVTYQLRYDDRGWSVMGIKGDHLY